MPAPTSLQSTAQQFLDIYDITNNLVILKNGNAALIINVSAMNFGLLAEAEQDAVIYTYAALLNSLNYPLQIFVESQTKDATNYLNLLKDQEAKASSKLKANSIAKYRDFVANLIKERNVLDKKFYVAVPATALELGLISAGSVIPGKDIFDISKFEKSFIIEKAQSILEPKRDHLIGQFGRIGLFAKQLKTQEIIRIFYNNYNPEATEGQELADTNQYTSSLVRADLLKNRQQTLQRPLAAAVDTSDYYATTESVQTTQANPPQQPLVDQDLITDQPVDSSLADPTNQDEASAEPSESQLQTPIAASAEINSDSNSIESYNEVDNAANPIQPESLTSTSPINSQLNETTSNWSANSEPASSLMADQSNSGASQPAINDHASFSPTATAATTSPTTDLATSSLPTPTNFSNSAIPFEDVGAISFTYPEDNSTNNQPSTTGAAETNAEANEDQSLAENVGQPPATIFAAPTSDQLTSPSQNSSLNQNLATDKISFSEPTAETPVNQSTSAADLDSTSNSTSDSASGSTSNSAADAANFYQPPNQTKSSETATSLTTSSPAGSEAPSPSAITSPSSAPAATDQPAAPSATTTEKPSNSASANPQQLIDQTLAQIGVTSSNSPAEANLIKPADSTTAVATQNSSTVTEIAAEKILTATTANQPANQDPLPIAEIP